MKDAIASPMFFVVAGKRSLSRTAGEENYTFPPPLPIRRTDLQRSFTATIGVLIFQSQSFSLLRSDFVLTIHTNFRIILNMLWMCLMKLRNQSTKKKYFRRIYKKHTIWAPILPYVMQHADIRISIILRDNQRLAHAFLNPLGFIR